MTTNKAFWTAAKVAFVVAFVGVFVLRVGLAVVSTGFRLIEYGNRSSMRSINRYRRCHNPYCGEVDCPGCIDRWA